MFAYAEFICIFALLLFKWYDKFRIKYQKINSKDRKIICFTLPRVHYVGT